MHPNIDMPRPRRIQAGPNAGQPRPASIQVVDGLDACKKAVLHLRAVGYNVIGAHAGADTVPVVQVAVDLRCHQAIGDHEAEYYRRSDTQLHGRFHAMLHGACVVWTERVQP